MLYLPSFNKPRSTRGGSAEVRTSYGEFLRDFDARPKRRSEKLPGPIRDRRDGARSCLKEDLLSSSFGIEHTKDSCLSGPWKYTLHHSRTHDATSTYTMHQNVEREDAREALVNMIQLTLGCDALCQS